MVSEMKNYIYLMLLLLWSTPLLAQEKINRPVEAISKEDWLADLNFMVKKVEEAFQTEHSHLKADFFKKAVYLKEHIPDWSSARIIVELAGLMAGLKDAHSSLNLLFDGVVVFDKVPLVFYAFEKQWYIIAADQDHEALLGGHVVKIGNFELEEVISKIKNWLSADNDMEVWANGGLVLQMPEILFQLGIVEQPDRLPLVVVSADGEPKHCEVLARPVRQLLQGPAWKNLRIIQDKAIYNQENSNKDYFYKYLEEEGMLYCYYGRSKDQEGRPKLKQFFSQLLRAMQKTNSQKILVDLRRNSGGDYTKSRPLVKGLEKRAAQNKGLDIFVATSRHTYSAAVVTAAHLKKRAGAILIGEPGRSNPNQTDDATFWRLPNSHLQFGLTVQLKQHLPELEALDYMPVDIPISLKVEDFKQGKDAVVEFVKRY